MGSAKANVVVDAIAERRVENFIVNCYWEKLLVDVDDADLLVRMFERSIRKGYCYSKNM